MCCLQAFSKRTKSTGPDLGKIGASGKGKIGASDKRKIGAKVPAQTTAATELDHAPLLAGVLPALQQLAACATTQRRLLVTLEARVQGFAAGAVPLTLLRAWPAAASMADLHGRHSGGMVRVTPTESYRNTP
jgi:hypothetical protein